MENQDRKDLGVILEDTTTESGLNDTWENVRDIVVRYTKRGQWLSNEEKRVSEPILKPRSGLEEHEPRARETMTEKGIDAATVEQLLKEMENLNITMVKKSDDRPTSSKYIDLLGNMSLRMEDTENRLIQEPVPTDSDRLGRTHM